MCLGGKWGILHPSPIPCGHLRVSKRKSEIPRALCQARRRQRKGQGLWAVQGCQEMGCLTKWGAVGRELEGQLGQGGSGWGPVLPQKTMCIITKMHLQRTPRQIGHLPTPPAYLPSLILSIFQGVDPEERRKGSESDAAHALLPFLSSPPPYSAQVQGRRKSSSPHSPRLDGAAMEFGVDIRARPLHWTELSFSHPICEENYWINLCSW